MNNRSFGSLLTGAQIKVWQQNEQREKTQQETEALNKFSDQINLPLDQIEPLLWEKNTVAWQVRWDQGENRYAYCDGFFHIADKAKRFDVIKFLYEKSDRWLPRELPEMSNIVEQFTSQLMLPLDELRSAISPHTNKLLGEYKYSLYLEAAKAKRLDVLKFLADELHIPLIESFDEGYRDWKNFSDCKLEKVFVAAIRNHDLEMLRWLIGDKKYLTSKQRWAVEGLILDASEEMADLPMPILKYLMQEEKFAITDDGDFDGETPLECALASGRLDVARWLVEEGLDKLDDYFKVALICATCDSTKINLNGLSDDKIHAINEGRLAVLKWLITEKGFSLEEKDSDDFDLLKTIFSRNNDSHLTISIMRWLLSEKTEFVVESFHKLKKDSSFQKMFDYFAGLSVNDLAAMFVDLKNCIDTTCGEAGENVKANLQKLLKAIIDKIGYEEAINCFLRASLYDEAIAFCQRGMSDLSLSEICRIKLAELILSGFIDPLDEKNSPLAVNSLFLSEHNFLRKRALQAFYLLESGQTETEQRLKARFHQSICVGYFPTEVAVSEKDWPLEAIHFYSLYKMYKTGTSFNIDLCKRFVELTNEKEAQKVQEVEKAPGKRKRDDEDDSSEEREIKRARKDLNLFVPATSSAVSGDNSSMQFASKRRD